MKAWHDQHCFLLDTKPVPVLSYKRSKHQSDLLGRADYGHCASRNLDYFGFKLVTISTLFGIPIFYDLVPVNTDERQAAGAVIDHFVLCDILGDKGFILSSSFSRFNLLYSNADTTASPVSWRNHL